MILRTVINHHLIPGRRRVRSFACCLFLARRRPGACGGVAPGATPVGKARFAPAAGRLATKKKAPRFHRGALVNPKLSERPYFPFFSSFLAPFFPFFFMSNLLQGLCRLRALAPATHLSFIYERSSQESSVFAVLCDFQKSSSPHLLTRRSSLCQRGGSQSAGKMKLDG